MKLNQILGTLNIAISTTPTAVTIPEKYTGANVLLIGAQNSNIPIQWRRQVSATATTSKLCPDDDVGIAINIERESTIFYAKTDSGTGTLEIEIWR